MMSPEKKAARKRDRELSKLIPIAGQVDVSRDHGITLLTVLIKGVKIEGEVEDFNQIIEKLGYRPVRVTRSMMNSEAKPFCIDINTPAYLDVGCESYWSA